MSDSVPDKQQLSVSVDAILLEQVDKLTNDRASAIEEGLRLWCHQQAENKLLQSAQAHKQRHDKDESGWLV